MLLSFSSNFEVNHNMNDRSIYLSTYIYNSTTGTLQVYEQINYVAPKLRLTPNLTYPHIYKNMLIIRLEPKTSSLRPEQINYLILNPCLTSNRTYPRIYPSLTPNLTYRHIYKNIYVNYKTRTQDASLWSK